MRRERESGKLVKFKDTLGHVKGAKVNCVQVNCETKLSHPNSLDPRDEESGRERVELTFDSASKSNQIYPQTNFTSKDELNFVIHLLLHLLFTDTGRFNCSICSLDLFSKETQHPSNFLSLSLSLPCGEFILLAFLSIQGKDWKDKRCKDCTVTHKITHRASLRWGLAKEEYWTARERERERERESIQMWLWMKKR